MKQRIYPVEEHQLTLDQIDPDALYVLERLRHAGFIAYLVGGSVRDLLLKKTPKDYDISTSAKPEEVKRLFRNSILIGRRFRLAHIRFGQKIIEVATFRSGENTDELILRDNIWGTPEEDVLRRDFTINGLFYDSQAESIIDYVGGYPDIQRRYLRTIGQPFLRFRQDPVRMIRLLKFQARFGLEVDPDTYTALLEERHEIVKSSSARILEELLRMLESGSSHPFFKLMSERGLLHFLMPPVASFMETAEGSEIHSYLQEVDTIFHEDGDDLFFDRPVLMSCLIFPLLQKRIQTRYLDRGAHPTLGEIQQEALDLLNETFRSFFQLPRKLCVSMVAIMTTQYRLTPLEKKGLRKFRIPNDPDFALGLKFLDLRACLEPGLQLVWEEWHHAFTSSESPTPKKRRRRSRSRSKGPGAHE